MTDAAAPAPPPAPPTSPSPASPARDAHDPPRGWRPPRRGHRTSILIGAAALIALLAVLAGWGLWPFAGRVEKTENAYVRGRTTVISPQVSGYVTEVPVQDFQQVAPGQVLVRIDDRIYGARVSQAEANLSAQLASLANSAQAQAARSAGYASQQAAVANARAQLLRAQADMRRVDDLVGDGSVSLRERDQTLAALKQAEAQVRQAQAAQEIAHQDIRTVQVGRGGLAASVEAARAALRLAQIDLDNTVIRAPTAGQLSEVGVRRGQYVTNGTQLLFLVPADVWITANFKETQTRRMRPGQPARFSVDALGGAPLTGHVERIAPAAGSEFAVLKADNATGNFVKVPQRIGVRIGVDPGQRLAARLRPGMSVEARVDTR